MGIDKFGEGIYENGADATCEVNGFNVFAVSTALSIFLFEVIVIDQDTTASGTSTLARRRTSQK
jgi:hypothetical protein